MLVTLCKTFDFDAAHWLPMVADGHKCKRLHGHTYRVDVICRGHIGHDGMLVDYADLAKAWDPIGGALDHRCLNEIEGLGNPTTEVLADWILRRLPEPVRTVRVWESSTTWCEVER